MRIILITSGLALTVCLAVGATPPMAASQDPSATTAPVGAGLGDLSAMTFSCPRAGLNAAARQAAKAPSQGTYQFSYFRIVSASHHSAYEVHFTSNYEGEPDLRYCVEMYCQQGWDPRNTQLTVTQMSTQVRGVNPHGDACGAHLAPAGRRTK